MKNAPYGRFEHDELILRDELAVDRTILANERTMLAYLRSSVALIIAGTTIMHFGQAAWFRFVGLVCVPVGVVVGIIGTVRYLIMKRAISIVRKRSEAREKQREQEAGRDPDSGMA